VLVVDWNAVGAVAGVVGVVVVIMGWVGRLAWHRLLEEMQQNKQAVEKVAHQVTPTRRPLRDGTLASSVGRIETKVDNHDAKDERRFGAIFPELGIDDPDPEQK
jgi:hypothetical protein